MTILKSNNAPAAKGGSASAQTDEGNVIIAGTNAATTFAEQIAKVEATRKEKGFDDIVKGLHLYGAKVVRPKRWPPYTSRWASDGRQLRGHALRGRSRITA